VYFNVNFNVFFKLIKVHLLVNEICKYAHQFSNEMTVHPICCYVEICVRKHLKNYCVVVCTTEIFAAQYTFMLNLL